MSWFGSLAGKAETLLNLVDEAAGQALQRDTTEQRIYPVPWENHESLARSHFSNIYPSQNNVVAGETRHILTSASVPVNLNKLNEGTIQSFQYLTPSSQSTTVSSRSSQKDQTSAALKKDNDAELFEFLNTPDSPLTNYVKPQSTIKYSSLPEKTSEEKPVLTGKKCAEAFENSQSVSNDIQHNVKVKNVIISGVSVSTENLQQQKLEECKTSLQMENKMLKEEVAALTQELNSVTKRSLNAQEELQTVCHQLADKSRSVHNTQELHTRLADMQETLNTKDTQLAILKVRLEEVNRELDRSRRSVDQMETETSRLRHDKSMMIGNGAQSYEAMEAKLVEGESLLRNEQERHRQLQDEIMEKLNALEADKQRLCSEVGHIQRFYEDEKARTTELQSQLKVAKSLADNAKQELAEYKEKAMRILQSKERLIMSLKEGSSSNQSNGEQMVSVTELETIRQERDMIREELHHTRMALETAKLEITELEVQLQQEQSLLQKRVESLEEQLTMEKKRREEIEEEASSYKQDINRVQKDLQKQTSALLSRIDDRDEEIHRLRNQVTMKSLSGNSQEELESRLHALTESLIQKQTMLEALSTEKNSLILQLERMEKQYKEAETEAFRVSASLAGVQDHQEARHRVSGLLRESPNDGEIARQMKHAANVLDRFSIRLGLFLRRYPIARVFVIIYMALLHFWVFIVLMTYHQEIHKTFQLPQPPNNQ